MVMGSIKQTTDVMVLGGGPGGYVAAIRAADLGYEVVLVEQRERCGGVCLLEGCIPSKALISAVEVMETAHAAEKMGITFEGLKVDYAKLRSFKAGVVDTLTKGIDGLLKARGVDVIHARGRLDGPRSLALEGADVAGIDFRHGILATGSRVTQLPLWKDLDVWTSREALELREVPERLLVVGGGYIGLELGLVYAGLGSHITVVELLPNLLSGADPDLVKPVRKRCQQRFDKVLLETRVAGMQRKGDVFIVDVESKAGREQLEVDQVLVAVGRTPNTEALGLERAGLNAGPRGLIAVDATMRTSVPSLFAIGDIVAGPGLAHKASREGKVAAEVIAGKPAAFDNVSIPAVVFTDPEVAWTGITESEAKAQGLDVTIGKFPLSALGRAHTLSRTDGLAKVIADKKTGLVRGVGLVGPHASELIASASLALELGAVLEDLTATIHPHPTLSEAMMEAAEVAEGLPVHLPPTKK
ncbi:MAG: dihydrolipoyl dehydrogenase [Deltaproteobacteria bacterium]|nr:dihydrolipoyl dehydrogenase [Deltaproteobacteria bacterium]